MKNTILIVPLLISLLYGCNNNDVSQQEQGENQATQVDVANQSDTVEVNQATNGEQLVAEKQVNTSINFTNFELDVDYAKDKSFEAEYETVGNDIVAEIDDEVNNIKIKGNDARNQLETYFKSLNFDAATTDDEVIKQVLNAFELKEDYISFELEVKFTDGSVKVYHANK